MPAFTLPIDIINRAAQLARQHRIASLGEHSEAAQEIVFTYDKIRESELSGNLWVFATKRVVLRSIGIDSVTWTPPAWVSATPYSAGAVVSDSPATGLYAGQTLYWQAKAATSGTTAPELDPNYSQYTGPLVIDLYNTGTDGLSATTYQAGEVVLVPSTYAGGTTYAANAVVKSGTVWYVSLAAANIGNAVSNTTWWTPWTSRGRSDSSYGVTASGSPIPLTYPGTVAVYVSKFNGNEDNPASATGNWLDVTGAIVPLQPMWPVGTGPAQNSMTGLNVYALPNAFLKRAPSSPRGPVVPYLGGWSGVPPDDWVEEGHYLVTRDYGPIMLRFLASVIDVLEMDTTFCEMLAAAIAEETLPSFKASDPKMLPILLSGVRRKYREDKRKAVLANAIEVGPVAMVENRYVTVRM